MGYLFFRPLLFLNIVMNILRLFLSVSIFFFFCSISLAMFYSFGDRTSEVFASHVIETGLFINE